MDWLEALILGIVQGATEYLPVSSSGHLTIFQELLGVTITPEQKLEFDVMVHFATVLSTITILFPMFRKLAVSFFQFRDTKDFRYVCKILLSCIPVGIVGVFFKDSVEAIFGSGLLVVGICLIVTAALLTFAHLSSINFATRHLRGANAGHDITWLDAFVIGIAQSIAVLPGLSRSGSTIATGILLGDRRSEVAQFSFIMVVIPIVGEALLDLVGMMTAETSAASAGGVGWLSMLIGFAAAYLVGCAACKWMIALVKKGRLVWFALYCVIVGILCIII